MVISSEIQIRRQILSTVVPWKQISFSFQCQHIRVLWKKWSLFMKTWQINTCIVLWLSLSARVFIDDFQEIYSFSHISTHSLLTITHFSSSMSSAGFKLLKKSKMEFRYPWIYKGCSSSNCTYSFHEWNRIRRVSISFYLQVDFSK